MKVRHQRNMQRICRGLEIDFSSFDFESDPATTCNLHLWLSPKVFGRIDYARTVLPIRSREDLAIIAILSYLDDLDGALSLKQMGLDDAAPA